MRIRKVDEFFKEFPQYQDTRYLDRLMLTSTTISGETSDGFFSSIWIPARKYDPQTGKLDEEYTYYNCGLSSKELADLYWTQYSSNYLIGVPGVSNDINVDYAYLETRCVATFKKNLGKYRRLLELEGLIWNPLWNVDGTELHQLLEKHGDEKSSSTNSITAVTGENTKDQRQVTAYDSDTLRTESEDNHTGQGGSVTPSSTATIGDTTISANGSQVPNTASTSSSAASNVGIKSHDSFNYAVRVGDTAFGTAIADGDVLHTEKTVKQGNIGVTKTTELIEDARDILKFSLIQEFFNDINEVILVGIY